MKNGQDLTQLLSNVKNIQYFTVPPLFLSESGHSSGIQWNGTGFQWIPVDSTGLQTEIEIELESGSKYMCTNSCKHKYGI